MRTVSVQPCMRLPLGKQGENEAVLVIWPGIVERYQALYGAGVFTITAKRCGDAEAYPVAVSTEGGDVVWLVQAADVAKPGSGSCELTYTVDGVVAKSQTWSTYVAASISGDAPGEPPEEPAKAWFAAIQAQIGNLDDLTTKAKANLVAAINEAAKTGSGGAGSISMRTVDGYIQYSTDDGASWENLIALADLKGPQGDPGKDGADGAPGKDGKDGTDGTNGITPTIGDNGNWYLGTTDTGNPSRGEKGDQGPAGAGMDITGATVGQIAKISAVDADGKPTAWEPVDLPSGGEKEWELIANTVVESEDATSYIYDVTGKTEFIVLLFLTPLQDSTTSVNGNVALNVRTTVPWGSGVAIGSSIASVKTSEKGRASVFHAKVVDGKMIPGMSTTAANVADANYMSLINNIRWYLNTADNANDFYDVGTVQNIAVMSYTKYFGVGSRIRIYAR